MEQFHPSRAYRILRIANCSWPLILLAFSLLMWRFVLGSAQGAGVLLLIGGVSSIWFVYEIVITARDFGITVALSEESICVGETTKQWHEIRSIELRRSSTRRPAIILYDATGGRIEIPAFIDGLPYIRGVVEARVRIASARTDRNVPGT